jgi:ACT domain-containing protein
MTKGNKMSVIESDAEYCINRTSVKILLQTSIKNLQNHLGKPLVEGGIFHENCFLPRDDYGKWAIPFAIGNDTVQLTNAKILQSGGTAIVNVFISLTGYILPEWLINRHDGVNVVPVIESTEHADMMRIIQIRNRLTMEVVMETDAKYLESVLGPSIIKNGVYINSITTNNIDNSGKWVVIVDDVKNMKHLNRNNVMSFITGKTATVRVSIDPSVFKTDEEAVMFMMGGGISYD